MCYEGLNVSFLNLCLNVNHQYAMRKGVFILVELVRRNK